MSLRHPGKHDYLVAAIFVVVATALVYSGVRLWKHWRNYRPAVDVSAYPVRGIDVSAHNGIIDFGKVKEAGIDFVFIKASEGTDFRDRRFSANIDSASAHGIPAGAYHFFRYDKDGVAQAVNLYNALEGRVPDLGVVIDVEDEGNPRDGDPAVVVANLAEMIDYLYLRGLPVMLYTNKDGYNQFLRQAFAGYPLWICSFSENPIDAEWTFWQYSHTGSVPGIKGNVDLNVFNGTREAWNNRLLLLSVNKAAEEADAGEFSGQSPNGSE